MHFPKDHGSKGGVGGRNVEKQWKCVFVEEHGGEGGIGKTQKLLVLEVLFLWLVVSYLLFF